jgi:hypothetical protein
MSSSSSLSSSPLAKVPDSGDSTSAMLKQLQRLEGAIGKLGAGAAPVVNPKKRPLAPDSVDPLKRSTPSSLCSFFATTGTCSLADKCRYEHRAATASADDIKELRRFADAKNLKSATAQDAQTKARALAERLAPA